MVKEMQRHVRIAQRQFVRGLSSLLSISETPPRRKATQPMDALRGDMERVGADMHRVVEREKRREKASRKTLTAAE